MKTHIPLNLPSLERIDSPGSYRYYKIPDTDEKFISITSVLSTLDNSWLQEWIDRVGVERAEKEGREAADRGTEIHRLSEMFLKNEDLDFKDVNTKRLFKQTEKKYLSKIDNIRCQELPLFSRSLGIAGTPDCIAEYEGLLAIIDFKTSKKIKRKEDVPNYFYQTCFYAICYYELFGVLPERLVLIFTTEKQGSFSIIENTKDWIKATILLLKELLGNINK